MYQASFDYQQNQEWNGKLKKIEIDPVTNKPKKDDKPKEPLWDAAKSTIAIVKKNLDCIGYNCYSIDYNNFVVDKLYRD